MVWNDLSDDELKQRLFDKMGNDPFALPLIHSYVETREDSDSIKWIDRKMNE